MRIKSPKNFWAGLMFIGIGLFFVLGARSFELGSAARMGPGYFPTLMGGIIAALGVGILIQSFVITGPKVDSFPLRLIFLISLALLLFGYLLKTLGLVVALVILVVLSALAGHQFKLLEAFLLAGVLVVMSVLIFVTGLGQPFPLWPNFF